MQVTDADLQAAFTFLQSQTGHIESEVNRATLPEIQYPRLIPVDVSAHPFARTVTYYSSEQFGRARWINGSSNDVPRAGTDRAQHETTVHMAGVGYGYGYEELNQALRAGVNLTEDDAMAARRASEEMIDRVAIFGDTEKGMSGLISHSAITPANAANGGWSAASADEILADINDALFAVGDGTLHTALADTVLVPYTSMVQIATKRIDGTSTSVAEYLATKNVYTAMSGNPLVIRAVRGLESAGAGSTGRMVAYRRSPEVLKLHLPMPHQFLEPMRDGPLNWVVPGVFRLGGLDVRRPKEVVYSDGI